MRQGTGQPQPGLVVPAPVAKLLASYERELYRQLPRALTGDDEAIHQLRVVARRLGLGLRLLEGVSETRAIRRARRLIGRLGRAAGRARDLSVVLDLFDARKVTSVPAPPAIARLRRRLAAAKRHAKAAMTETILDLDVAGLRALMRRVLSTATHDPQHSGLLLAARAQTEAANLLTELRQAARFKVELLHDLRRRARRLRYLAEIQSFVRSGDSGAASCFKTVQDALGTIRDLWLLADWCGKQVGSKSAARDAVSRGTASRLYRSVYRELRALHREWLAGRTPASVRQGLERMGVGVRVQRRL